MEKFDLGKGIIVEIPKHKVELAKHWGGIRFERGKKLRAKHGQSKKSHTLDIEIQSCGAEITVAHFTGAKWREKGIDDGVDVPPDIQVRWTPLEKGKLIIHPPPGDRKDVRFVLVVGKMPYQRVAGWVSAGGGMIPKYWTNFGHADRPHCYGVPQSELNPIDELA